MTPDDLKAAIRTIPDYPKTGIMFRDVTTLLLSGKAFAGSLDLLVNHHTEQEIDLVAGIEARGFIIGGAMAHRLGVGFVPIRKQNKLPGETISEDYELEYGKDTIEIHADAVQRGQRVLVVDDLLATGGTAVAAVNLLERAGAVVPGCSFIIDLPDLGGRTKLEARGLAVKYLVEFEGD